MNSVKSFHVYSKSVVVKSYFRAVWISCALYHKALAHPFSKESEIKTQNIDSLDSFRMEKTQRHKRGRDESVPRTYLRMFSHISLS